MQLTNNHGMQCIMQLEIICAPSEIVVLLFKQVRLTFRSICLQCIVYLSAWNNTYFSNNAPATTTFKQKNTVQLQ